MTRALRLALLAAVVVAAALRLARAERRLPLEDLVARLRRARRLPRPLADPEACRAVVDALLPRLPPRRMRRCLRRSLLLLDLWSRCGLEPRLHLGARTDAGRPAEGHAWLTLPDGGGDGGAGFQEVWRSD